VQKYLKQVTLLDRVSSDEKQSVEAVLKAKGLEYRFRALRRGEGIEEEIGDFAAEVMSRSVRRERMTTVRKAAEVAATANTSASCSN